MIMLLVIIRNSNDNNNNSSNYHHYYEYPPSPSPFNSLSCLLLGLLLPGSLAACPNAGVVLRGQAPAVWRISHTTPSTRTFIITIIIIIIISVSVCFYIFAYAF